MTVPADGRGVDSYTLANSQGASVSFISLGGCITGINMPDRNGVFGNVVLGHREVSGYASGKPYLGAIIGRYANRIGGGVFELDGQSYHLVKNDWPNALHGGPDGFHGKIWQVERGQNAAGDFAVLTYSSPDGEAGYPGQLDVKIVYTLSEDNTLTIAYEAVTTKTTVLNLTNHSYFNLDGEASGAIFDQSVQIFSEFYTPVDAARLPTGIVEMVAGTPMDFRTPHKIGARLQDDFAQLRPADGYDHNWILSENPEKLLRIAAIASSARSGRRMAVHTTEPGVQFYTANDFDATVIGSSGAAYEKYAGYTFETQNYPDAPNRPGFPTAVLHPGMRYRSTTRFEFSVID